MTMISTQTVPTPYRGLLIPIEGRNSGSKGTGRAFPEGDPLAASRAWGAKKAEWAKLALCASTRLRQDFTDEAFMREHLSVAGVRAPISTEPATVSRLRTMLKRAGVQAPEIAESVGTTLVGFLTLNPKLPLWAALALVLESTGRFTPRSAP